MFRTLIFALSAWLLCGCMGIEDTNTHLASMDQSTLQLNQSIQADQAYFKSVTEHIALMEKHMDALETQFAADNKHIESVALCLQSLSESLAAIRKLGDDSFKAVMTALVAPHDAPTPDPDDVLPPARPKPNS